MDKRRVALWAVRNPTARRLVMRGLKNRRVRGLAWGMLKRQITR